VSDEPELAEVPDPTPMGSPNGPYIGLASRTISFVLDATVINVVALVVSAGVVQVLSLFHVSKTNPVVVTVGLVAYVLWAIAYFIVFWSTTGETPGGRVMRLQVIGTDGQRLKPRRALLRFVGALLAALPLFAGYLMILIDSRRRAFQDRLAHTVVVESPRVSLAAERRARRRAEWSGDSPNSGDERAAFVSQS
jgi:uncharacterized RDD family membrane protein YckC